MKKLITILSLILMIGVTANWVQADNIDPGNEIACVVDQKVELVSVAVVETYEVQPEYVLQNIESSTCICYIGNENKAMYVQHQLNKQLCTKPFFDVTREVSPVIYEHAPKMIFEIESILLGALNKRTLDTLIEFESNYDSQVKPPDIKIYTAGITIPDDFNWTSAINVALLLVSTLFGGAWVVGKKKGRLVANALSKILDAVEDNNISAKEEKEIVSAIRAIFKKE